MNKLAIAAALALLLIAPGCNQTAGGDGPGLGAYASGNPYNDTVRGEVERNGVRAGEEQ